MTTHIAFKDTENDMIVAPRASIVLSSVLASRKLTASVCINGFEQTDYDLSQEEFGRLAEALQT